MEMNRIEQTKRMLEGRGQKIVSLSSGNAGEFGVRFPEEILMKAFTEYQKSPAYLPEPKGSEQARSAVAKFYERRGLTVPSENIILTSGTSESYLHLFKLLAKSGDEMLFPNPSYPLFDHLAGLAGVSLGHYDLNPANGWQIDLQHLESKLSAKTGAIVLVSPNNPTGGVLNRENLTGVLAIAQKHRIPIISDEVFSEFIFEGNDFPRAASMAREYANGEGATVFTLNGISKTYALPGLKLSWIAATGPGAPQAIEELELSVDTLLACNQISQAMLPAIIDEGEKFLQSYRDRVKKSRDTAIQILETCPHLSFHKSAGGFYLFPEVKNFPGTDEDFVIRMMENTGIFVHPGYFYDYEKGLHVLISFLMEAGELEPILERFVRAVNLSY